MDDETNINDTIENDLKNRDKGLARREVEKQGRKAAKKASRKTRKKLASTLFKKVGFGAIIGFFPLFILIFMIVGMISFITTMPGLVQEGIMNKMLSISNSLSSAFYGSDYYLDKLIKDDNRQSQKEILLYLDRMGIDPVGFGFASFYRLVSDDPNVKVTAETATWENVEYEPNVDYDGGQNISGFLDSVRYNNWVAKKRLTSDLLLKYILSNERIYAVHDKDKDTWYAEAIKDYFNQDFDVSGMVNILIPGIDDSKITTDRDNKQMVITSNNFVWDGWSSEIVKQTAKYNLESWVGRYGTPLELLLALHIGTMTSDLTDEMITNPYLNTKVDVVGEKGEYNVEYEIKYDGKELPFKATRAGISHDLDELREKFTINQDKTGIVIDATDDEILAFKDKVSINSLMGWIEYLKQRDFKSYQQWETREKMLYDSTNAFLGDVEYRVRMQYIGSIYGVEGGFNNWRTWARNAFYGVIPETTEESGMYAKYHGLDGEILSEEGLDVVIDSQSKYTDKGVILNKIRWKNDNIRNEGGQNITGNVYINLNGPEPADLTQVSNEFDEKYYNIADHFGDSSRGDEREEAFSTAVLHGLDYYINGHMNEVKDNEYIRIGIGCMLSQFDAYLYSQKLDGLLNKECNFTKVTQRYWSGWANPEISFTLKDSNGVDKEYKYNFKYGLHVLCESSNDDAYWALTAEWMRYQIENEGNYTEEGLREELIIISDRLKDYLDVAENKTEFLQSAVDQLFEVLYPDQDITLTIKDLKTIYEVLCNNSADYEYVFPRIKTVTRHWYKDIIFEDENQGIKVYDKNSNSFRLPFTPETQTDKSLEVTAILSGDSNYVQNGQPYVVKGDVVTLGGEVVKEGEEHSDLSKQKSEIALGISGYYTYGDGYRIAKRLFTQGQYYVYDGTPETSKSIYHAKILEGLNTTDKYAVVVVQNRRLCSVRIEDDMSQLEEFIDSYDESTNEWNIDSQIIADERKNEEICRKENAVTKLDDGTSVFLKYATVSNNNKLPYEIYLIVANSDLSYKSVGSFDVTVEESKKSVERINNLLESMNVITKRKPISFDNTTATGDVTALTAFGILEGTHTESAEHIYRDLKEFLIELGYYTKAEFEYLDTKVLNWFIPKYIPSTQEKRANWRQNKEQDALYYGAYLYPKGEKDAPDEEETDPDGFLPDLEVIAPGNCRIVEIGENNDSITIKFDGSTEPEIGILDGYKMIISGIKLNEEANIAVINKDSDDLGEKSLDEILANKDDYIIKANSVIGYTGNTKIHIVMKTKIDGNIDNIEDYMGPNISTNNNSFNDDVLLYWTQWESGDRAGIVNVLQSNVEVACGVAQWTTTSNLSQIQYVCGRLASLNPALCGSLNAFSSWSNEQVLNDISGNNSQIKKAFELIAARDYDTFKNLQYQIVVQDRTQVIESKGMDYVKDKKIVYGSLISLMNWRPYWPWETLINDSMSEEEMIVRLFKYAWDKSDEDAQYVNAWRARWNCQAKFAVDVINGTYTDLDAWLSGNASNEDKATYQSGKDDGWLNNKAKSYGL